MERLLVIAMHFKGALTRLVLAIPLFAAAQLGNVAVTFALASLPVVGAVGFAVDYSHANSVKAAMQAALDSTALMLAKEAATDTNAQLQSNALKYFLALFTRPEAKSIVITATYSSSAGSQIIVNGSAQVPTSFLGIIGYDKLTVNGSSTTKWGSSRLRVALALDNTGSMADNGKMTALKSATKSLLTQLKTAVTVNGDVYVSIVPFVKDVNVDPKNKGKNWIDWTAWNAKNGTCTKYSGSSEPTDETTCLNQSGKWKSANTDTWNGCVTDRGDASQPNPSNYDTNVTAPTKNITATLYSAEQFTPCPQPVMALSYDWTSMNSLIDSMSPGGNTNQAIGLQVSWMSLVGGGPFPKPPKMDSNYKYQQIIILLTDGMNTQDRWYTDQSSIDARQKITCDNVKAAGITLYTIQVNTGGDPTSTLLQNCASSSDKFYLLTKADQITATFEAIGTNLTKLRVAK